MCSKTTWMNFPKKRSANPSLFSVDIDNKLVMDAGRTIAGTTGMWKNQKAHTRRDRICMIWKVIIKCWICIFSFQKSGTAHSGRKSVRRAQKYRRRDQPHFKDRMCQLYPKCTICGRELSWDYPFSICERCFERGKRVHPRRR